MPHVTKHEVQGHKPVFVHGDILWVPNMSDFRAGLTSVDGDTLTDEGAESIQRQPVRMGVRYEESDIPFLRKQLAINGFELQPL